MILVDIQPSRPLAPHRACGHVPRLIEARGRASTDARLFGRPARAWHVECCRCGIATQVHTTPRRAELAWRVQAELVPTDRLPTLRLAAERAMAAAAA